MVDQNEDDRLEPVLAPYQQELAIKRLRSRRGTFPGTQHRDQVCDWRRNRVPGRRLLVSERPSLQGERSAGGHPAWDGVTGRSEDGGGSASAGTFDPNRVAVDLLNVCGRGISFTIFLRRRVVERVGEFDETLGSEQVLPTVRARRPTI